jgi:hypothetical protein
MAATIATELKFTAVVAIYALFKLLEQAGILQALAQTSTRTFLGLELGGEYSLLTVLNDGLFYVGHSYLYNRYMRSSDSVLKDTALSTKDKVRVLCVACVNLSTSLSLSLCVCVCVCVSTPSCSAIESTFRPAMRRSSSTSSRLPT